MAPHNLVFAQKAAKCSKNPAVESMNKCEDSMKMLSSPQLHLPPPNWSTECMGFIGKFLKTIHWLVSRCCFLSVHFLSQNPPFKMLLHCYCYCHCNIRLLNRCNEKKITAKSPINDPIDETESFLEQALLDHLEEDSPSPIPAAATAPVGPE